MKPIDFDAAVSELERLDLGTVSNTPTAFEITGQLSVKGLKRLTALPFEVLISVDSAGTVIMSTGTATRARHKDDLEAKQRIYGELSIHTHPFETGIVANAPSLSDIQLSETVNALRSEPRTEYIVHAEGIVMYCVDKNYLEERIIFYRNRGVSIVENEIDGYRKLQDIPRSERVALVRQFCEEVGIIHEEAAWTNTNNIQKIVDHINDAIAALEF